MGSMWQRRLLFNAVFVFGTCVAVYGWLMSGRYSFLANYFILGGHAAQIAGLLGSLITPDKVEKTSDRAIDQNAEIETRL